MPRHDRAYGVWHSGRGSGLRNKGRASARSNYPKRLERRSNAETGREHAAYTATSAEAQAEELDDWAMDLLISKIRRALNPRN